MYQSNWFEERLQSTLLATCEAIQGLTLEQRHGVVGAYLKQVLFDCVRLYFVSNSGSRPPAQQEWMLGDSERNLHLVLRQAERLLNNPASCAVWLQSHCEKLGVIPPEEWEAHKKNH